MRLAVIVTATLIASFVPAAAQTPSILNVVSQATLAAPVSPGMPVLVNGTNLGGSTPVVCSGPKVPLTCGGVTVTVNDRAVPVRIAYQTQIVAYIPADQAPGQVNVVVKNQQGQSSAPFAVAVETYAPGIQKLGDSAGNTIGFFSDGSQRIILRTSPAVPGQEVIAYAVGLGPTVPVIPAGETGTAPVVTLPVVWLGSRQVPVMAAGLGCGALCDPGIYLVHFVLPADVPNGDLAVSIEVAGKRSGPATLVVGPPTNGPAVGYVQTLIDSRSRVVSPGMIASVVGAGFLNQPSGVGACSMDSNYWPMKCAGVTVTINGRLAPIQMVTPNFITIQIPWELSAGPASLVVERTMDSLTQKSTPLDFTLETLSPTLPASSVSAYAGVAIENSGGPASPTNPLLPGDNILIYAQGLGQTNPPLVTGFGVLQPTPTVMTPTVTIGGKALENVACIAMPGAIGTYRVSGRVPSGIAAGDQPIVLEIGGKKSQTGLMVPVAEGMIISAVTNAASGTSDIVSGSWVSIYGRNLSATTRQWTDADFIGDWLPTEIDGVNVTIGGMPAAVAFVSPLQLNVLAPDGLPMGPVEVIVQSPLGWQKSTANVKGYAPGIFPLPVPPGRFLAALHTDWTYVARQGQLPPNYTVRPARPGETIIFFGTGFGPTIPEASAYHRFSGLAPLSLSVPVQVLFGGVRGQVTFVGLVGNGLYQLNVVVPDVPDGDQEVVMSIGAEASPRGKYIAVQR